MPTKQQEYLEETLGAARRYIMEEKPIVKGMDLSCIPPDKVREVIEVLSFVVGFVDGVGALANLDRVDRAEIMNRFITHGKAKALDGIGSVDQVNTPLWSELNPN